MVALVFSEPDFAGIMQKLRVLHLAAEARQLQKRIGVLEQMDIQPLPVLTLGEPAAVGRLKLRLCHGAAAD